MKYFKYLCLLVPIFTTTLSVFADNSGKNITPVIENFNKSAFFRDAQNWSVGRTDDGIMHFANNEGMLSFDGIRWELDRIADGKGVRSICCTSASESQKERIYVGAFEEFGYFETDSEGNRVYTSLSDRLSEWPMQNDDIWTILDLGDRVFFHAFTSGYIYTPESDILTSCHFNSFVESVGVAENGKILCSSDILSVVNPISGEVTKVEECPMRSRLVTVIKNAGKDVIVTLNDGLWLYDGENFSRFTTEADGLLREFDVNRAYSLDDDIIIGSSRDGCIRIDKNGRLVWHVNTFCGLQSNTVLGINEDIDGNIWLALDSGISYINGDKSVSIIDTRREALGAIYCTHLEEKHLYIGTNQGLYTGVFNKDTHTLSDLHRLTEVGGNVWFIKNYDGQIICGANSASYELKNGKVASMLAEVTGGTCIDKGYIHGQNVLIQGTYTKLCVYVQKNGKWQFSHLLSDFIEPISYVNIDFRGNIWAAHSHEGVYRIELSQDLENIVTKEYFPNLCAGSERELIAANNIQGRIVLSNGKSSYTYDDMSGRIVPYDILNRSLGKFSGARRICPEDGEKYWMIFGDEAALVDFTRPDSILIEKQVPYSLFGGAAIEGRQDIRHLEDGTNIFALDGRLGILKEGYRNYADSCNRMKIVKVIMSDRNKNGIHCADLSTKQLHIDFKDRLIDVWFACPRYSPPGGTHYSYRLIGRDNIWTELGGLEGIELNHLRPGRYTLQIKAKNTAGEEAGYAELPFKVNRPFYSSVFAFVVYILFALLFLMLVLSNFIRQARSRQEQLERKNLEDEVKAKSKLIASSTMSLIRKNEILSEIKEELRKQKTELGQAYPERYYRKMISTIDNHISSEEDWEIFQRNFDRIHSGFFQILKERYPELTPTDLRFCAFLCMNMTSKEIASMMNISLKGVEAARYRIRKKVGLASELSLTDFLMNLR